MTNNKKKNIVNRSRSIVTEISKGFKYFYKYIKYLRKSCIQCGISGKKRNISKEPTKNSSNSNKKTQHLSLFRVHVRGLVGNWTPRKKRLRQVN